MEKNNLKTFIKSYLVNTDRHRLHLILGLIFLAAGLVVSFLILTGPNTNDQKTGLFSGNPNFAYISASDTKNGRIDNVKYKVSIIPSSGTNDLLITVVTSLVQSKNTTYIIDWPGVVRPHMFNEIALDANESTSSELLGIKVKKIEPHKYEISVHSRNDNYHKYKDYFMFYWENGKESLNFSEGRIRLTLHTSGENSSIEFKIGLTEDISLVDEAPEASKVIPNVSMGAIERVYNNAGDVFVVLGDRFSKRLADFLLILSGLLFGISTGFLTGWIITEADNLRKKNANKSVEPISDPHAVH